MAQLINYDDIRPYSNDELQSVLQSLLSQQEFIRLVDNYFPAVNIKSLASRIGDFNDIDTFQRVVIAPVLEIFLRNVTSDISCSGIENYNSPAILMSNHRDIVMDPAILAFVMLKHFSITPEIAMGDNLLATKWIEDFVRLNKSIIVKRSISASQKAKAFMQLSSYIRYAVTQKHSSVWIAQREGRAKDSNDRTQESLVKMLALSGDKSFIDNVKELNITPLTISYEFDPCDYLKAKELYERKRNPQYTKAPGEDVFSMQTGIMGFKGRVHYAFSPSINSDLDDIASAFPSKKEQAVAVCELCDKRIHSAYKFFPINRYAYKLITRDNRFDGIDSGEELLNAEKYVEGQLSKIKSDNADFGELRDILLRMYANPLINNIAATEK